MEENILSHTALAVKCPTPKILSTVRGGPVQQVTLKTDDACKERGAREADEVISQMIFLWIHYSQELEENFKHDCDQFSSAFRRVHLLLVAGGARYDCIFQHSHLLDGGLKLSLPGDNERSCIVTGGSSFSSFENHGDSHI